MREPAARIAEEGICDLGKVAEAIPDKLFSNLLGYQRHSEPVAIREGLPLLKPHEIDETKHYACYRFKDYIEHPAVLRFMFDRQLYSIAKSYLGDSAHLASVVAWRTFANPIPSKTAQRFHRDTARGRSLALFVYLNDVGQENGPHAYVKQSHTFAAFARALSDINRLDDERRAEILYYSYALEDGNRYQLDDAIEDSVPHLVHTQLGKAGSGLLTEPRGIHRGNAVVSGYRMMLSMRWHPGPFRQGSGHLRDLLNPMIRNEEDRVIAAQIEAIYDETYG
jgi:hypothetical protein